MRDKEAQLIWEAYEEAPVEDAPVEDRPTKCKRCGGTGKKNSTTSQRLAGWPSNTQCKQCNGTGDSSKGTGDGWGPYKNKLKEDHHPDSDEHAKQVQWTKDVKAKLAKAQEIGDSKEANKLQRFLDMHGIDEAYDSWIDDPVGDDNPHLKPDKSDTPADPSSWQEVSQTVAIKRAVGEIYVAFQEMPLPDQPSAAGYAILQKYMGDQISAAGRLPGRPGSHFDKPK